MPPAPKMVNRGGAGLLSKLPHKEESTVVVPAIPDSPINKISETLKGLIVSIDDLQLDPDNARLHPDRNMEAIRQSLQMYGQLKPVVVRRDKMIIVAGNGTVEAAKQLGWTKVAASVVDMTDAEAAGYGLADNRSAELAKWDFEVVARLDRLLLEASHPSIGWSTDELEVLRAADWTPPTASDDAAFGSDDQQLVFSFTPDQYEHVDKAIQQVRAMLGSPDLDPVDCITKICQTWTSENSDAGTS